MTGIQRNTTKRRLTTKKGNEVKGKDAELLKKIRRTDKYLSWVEEREKKIKIGNFRGINWDDSVSFTITSSGQFYRGDKSSFSRGDFINVQTFPQDYNFLGQSVQYICGMSVPPVMMAQVARQIERQWLND